jgi:hypothetical protein
VAALLQQRGALQQFNDPQDKGGICQIDRASGQFKQAMYKVLQSRNTSVFYDKAAEVIRALSERPSEVLGGAQPSGVAANDRLQHLILTRNSSALERNHGAFIRFFCSAPSSKSD